MEANALYKISADYLMQARLIQSQIVQKEFEIKLLGMNNRYAKYDSYGLNVLIQTQSIEREIGRMKYNRDDFLYKAIDYALQLVEIEQRMNVLFSMAYLAVSSINSFLQSEKLKPPMGSSFLQMRVLQLMQGGIVNPLLRGEMEKLKSFWSVF